MNDLKQIMKRARWFLIFGISLVFFVGTVFVTQPVRNRRISEDQAISVTAVYADYWGYSKRIDTKWLDLKFEDHEDLSVDGCCVRAEWVEKLDDLPAGTTMHLLVHPRSGNVLQIEANGEVLLAFHDAQTKVWRESLFFGGMGLFLYACEISILVVLIRSKRR